jgi:hypothetical protein
VAAPTPQQHSKPAAAEPQDLAAKWRRLALAAYSAIDQALDSAPSEASAILAEVAGELEGAIDQLDALAMAAEGAA